MSMFPKTRSWIPAMAVLGWSLSSSGAAEPQGLGEPGELVEILIGREAGADGALEPAGVLRGGDARLQLVVTGRYASNQLRDLSDRVRYAAEPEGIVAVDATGLVTPLANGEVAVTARLEGAEGELADVAHLRVESFDEELPVNFPNQIVPIFTKLGCNGGGCHGKSGGQNGFALSLLGFYPEEDYEYLVKESQGRRVSTAAPAHSLLLLKATNTLPHGGGARIERGSYEYRLLRRWMLQGMPYGKDSDPVVERIEVYPEIRRMDRHSRQQLSVLAHYSDGAVEDVTRMATYEPNEEEMAEASPTGVVRTHDLSGEVAVMIRYQGQVGVFRGVIPLGVEVTDVPEPRGFIDELVFAKWRDLGIPPSPICDDATFLRRATIDIAGRLPTHGEVVSFLADEDPEKRSKLVDRLVDSPGYADYFANKWSAILRNKRENDKYVRGTYAFHDWIRESLYHNKPYDEFAREILAAAGSMEENPPVAWYRAVRTTEEQVEDSAQLFLGLRIQCARCHHHPFERWSQRDYYGYSAFFSRVARKDNLDGIPDEQRVYHNPGRASSRNPRSGEDLRPTGLGGAPLDLPPDRDPREALADWMTGPENPFFAPALVNRYWKHFFGRGLVEPEDDMRETNPPSHPELLEALADHFRYNGWDLKDLVRTISKSATYQLSAYPNEYNAKDKQSFSRYYPRRLNAEVLYDAIHQVTGTETSFGGLPSGLRATQLPDTGANNYFLTVFGRPMAESSCECERSNDASLAQSLHLLNSNEILGKISDGNGRAALLAKDDQRETKEKLTELYLRVYARAPEPVELEVSLDHIEKAEDKKAAYEDIVWALLNTKEFLFNH